MREHVSAAIYNVCNVPSVRVSNCRDVCCASARRVEMQRTGSKIRLVDHEAQAPILGLIAGLVGQQVAVYQVRQNKVAP